MPVIAPARISAWIAQGSGENRSNSAAATNSPAMALAGHSAGHTRSHSSAPREARISRSVCSALEPVWNSLGSEYRVIFQSWLHHAPEVALDQDLGGGRTRIVCGRHD